MIKANHDEGEVTLEALAGFLKTLEPTGHSHEYSYLGTRDVKVKNKKKRKTIDLIVLMCPCGDVRQTDLDTGEAYAVSAIGG